MVQYSNLPIQSKCPVCGNADARNLYSVTAGESAQHFVRKEANSRTYSSLVEHIKKLWGADTCNVNCCNNCQFCFSEPYVAGDFDFYHLAHPRHGYPKWKWENQITLDAIKHHCNNSDTSKTRLLEIGAGNGAFIRRVKDIIPITNITCTEYSEYGVKQITAMGAKCFDIDVRTLDDMYNNHFDFVCLFQVLEHLDDLDSLFAKIDKITKAEAQIYIAVPNDKFIQFIETNDALLDMPPNHIGRWNKKAFGIIAEKQGWKITDHRYEHAESALTMANRFCIYRFQNESQKRGTVANHIARIGNRYIRFMLMQIVSKFYGLTSLKGLIRSLSKEYGMAQWVCISKK